MDNGTFDFNLFLKESKDTLLNPKSYFSTMKISGGIIEPLIKAGIYGVVTALIYLLFGILRIGVYGGGIIGGTAGISGFFSVLIGALIGVFVGAVILLILSSICKGNTDFEANFRVTASLMVVMPVSALLSFFSGINIYLGTLVSLIVLVYSLWLLYHGIVEALKGKADTAKIVCYVMIALVALILLLGLNKMSKFDRAINNYNRDARELLRDTK